MVRVRDTILEITWAVNSAVLPADTLFARARAHTGAHTAVVARPKFRAMRRRSKSRVCPIRVRVLAQSMFT